MAYIGKTESRIVKLHASGLMVKHQQMNNVVKQSENADF